MATVLVLNDDEDLLELYEEVLRELGHEPVTRFTTDSGPEAVRDVGADALLVDLMRPDEKSYGLRIIEEVRRDPELHDLPVILCTAGTEQVRPLLERLERLDVPVVAKPFGMSDLQAVLQRALGETEKPAS